MKVSVLIATYNRAELLARALKAGLAQDYEDIEFVVIDDCSADQTPEVVRSFHDRRIRYVRNPENIGGQYGDVAIIRKFLDEFCDGDCFIYLCDDDYWRPTDLITRQVTAMLAYPSLAFVQGGMAHCYPHPIPDAEPNADYLQYSFLDEAKTQLFWGGLFPDGFLYGRDFLRLFAEDTKNRNIVMGATMYRTAKFKASGIMQRIEGVRWQAGYAIVCGSAVHGDVYYMDEPCLMVAVRKTTASHSGTQFANFRESLNSIDTAFTPNPPDAELCELRANMMHDSFTAFLCNKIANKAGWFNEHALGDISEIMTPEITGAQFIAEMAKRNVPLTKDNLQLLQWSDMLPIEELKNCTWWQGVLKMAN